VNRACLVAAAFASDLACGDPRWFPHPVRVFGAAIASAERLARRFTRRDPVREMIAGTVVAVSIIVAAYGSVRTVTRPSTRIDPRLTRTLEIAFAWTTLATRDLLAEADAVIAALERNDLDGARARLRRIVGRDTATLDASEIARATIETLAESACDGIVAPLCALALGGAPLAVAFKAISTLDSMLGHIEAPYTYFGRCAARLDDVACWLPARATALLICACAALAPGSARDAWATWRADGRRHASPNAGQPEAAMAGALRVRLGGVNRYDEEFREAPVLGVRFRPPTAADARRAQRLVAVVAGAVAAALTVSLSLGGAT